MNLASYPHLLARYEPNRVAIEQIGRRVTYAEFEVASRSFAHRLRDHGLTQGDVAALLTRDDIASLAAMFAIWRLGAILLPIDWRLRPSERSRIVARFQPRLIATTGPDETGQDQLRLGFDDIGSASSQGEFPIVQVDDAPALLALSSGTTGEPKAVVITHRQHQARVMSYSVSYPILREDRYLSTLAIAYNWGRNLAISHLCLGATLILHPTIVSANELVAAAKELRATTLAAVPYVSRALLQWAGPRSPVLGGLRRYFSATAPLFAEERIELRAHVAANLTEVYGTTETGGLCVLPPEEQDRAPGSVGRPAIGVEIEVVDADDRGVPRGSAGWIRCRGPGVSSGYLQGTAEDDSRFKDGWYYTGDYGWVDMGGFFYLDGRVEDVIKRGGMTIYAAEVERVLRAHPAVAEAAVLGRPSLDVGEDIVAFVVLRHNVDETILANYCRIALATFKQPQAIRILPAIPRNATGKVIKSALFGAGD